MKTKKTHDYSKRRWGHDCTFETDDNGLTAHSVGWGVGLSEGDYILLEHKGSPNGSSRYRIEKIKYFRDPPDMWSADLVFAPRLVEDDFRGIHFTGVIEDEGEYS